MYDINKILIDLLDFQPISLEHLSDSTKDKILSILKNSSTFKDEIEKYRIKK